MTEHAHTHIHAHTLTQIFCCCSVAESCPTNSLQPHGLQYVRFPCPSPTPRIYSNSCSSSWWCHPTISSSVIPFSSHLQSFPASGSFPVSQFFASGGQSTGASASILPMNTQDWSPLWWTGWTSLQSKGLLGVFSKTNLCFQKHKSFGFLYGPTLTSLLKDYWKNHSFDYRTFVGKVISALDKCLCIGICLFGTELPYNKVLFCWGGYVNALQLIFPAVQVRTLSRNQLQGNLVSDDKFTNDSIKKHMSWNKLSQLVCVHSPVQFCDPLDCSLPGSSAHGIF